MPIFPLQTPHFLLVGTQNIIALGRLAPKLYTTDKIIEVRLVRYSSLMYILNKIKKLIKYF